MRKRITGLLLGICLVISMLPVTSFAAAYMAHSYEEWCDFIERYPGTSSGMALRSPHLRDSPGPRKKSLSPLKRTCM